MGRTTVSTAGSTGWFAAVAEELFDKMCLEAGLANSGHIWVRRGRVRMEARRADAHLVHVRSRHLV